MACSLDQLILEAPSNPGFCDSIILLLPFWHLKVGCGGGAFSLCAWAVIQGSHQHGESSAGGMMLTVSFSSLCIYFSMFIDMLKDMLFLHSSASKFTMMSFTYVGYWFFILHVPLSKLVLPSSHVFTPLMANNWPINDDLFTEVLYINQCQCFQGLWDHPTPLPLCATFYSRVTHIHSTQNECSCIHMYVYMYMHT